MRSPANKVIEAVGTALPIVSESLKIARTDRIEVFVDSTPGAGESFEINVQARSGETGAFKTVKTILVSEAEPINAAEISLLGREARIEVKAGGAEVAFTGKVEVIRIEHA